MLSIRKTKTGSGKVAVQVVHYHERKVVIDAHLGSADTKETIELLVTRAHEWIHKHGAQSSLFPPPPRRILNLETARFVGSMHTFAYTVVSTVATKCGFGELPKLLIDLAIMRIVEPSSKLRAIELMARYFGIIWTSITVYRTLPKLKIHKAAVEEKAVSCAKTLLHANLSVILYDVTTLYFETFKEDDDLRKRGFSKDHKVGQPQIVVGLLVTDQGFPVGYEVFNGKTFEGHTMLPVLQDFVKKHEVKIPTVVADAGMISLENVKALKAAGYSYIVGGRLANSNAAVLREIAAVENKDGTTLRLSTDRGDLICAYSEVRFRKDKHEMEKQTEKAREIIAGKKPIKRVKFVSEGAGVHTFNEELKRKAETLLGWKGYYTNIPTSVLSDVDIVSQYKRLWHVEAAFRMTKNDLETRPIFHHKEDAVRAHMLICFVALCLGTYLELKTGQSLRAVRDTLWSVADAHVIDTRTGETIILRSEPAASVEVILKKLGMSY